MRAGRGRWAGAGAGLLIGVLASGAALAGVGWAAAGRVPVTGDEPHYLIIAASVLRDFDFDVSNNYEQDAASGEIYGPVRPHALMPAGAPTHMPGLGVLLAAPFGLGGVLGARAGLALLVVAVLGVAVLRWSRTFLPPGDALLATFGVLGCAPVLFGASQLYPDLAGGAAVFALAGWLAAGGGRRHEPSEPHPRPDGRHALGRSRRAWCVWWLFAGMLCWLHVKYYAPSAVLAAAGAWRLWREMPRYPAATYAAFAALFLAGPALFGAFSVPAFGDMLGGRGGGGEIVVDLPRAFELFLGLHFDQVHGMFVQQPLLLPGLAALGWMLRRRPGPALVWLLLYASLTAPNALQAIPYGGGAAPAGRFGWSAMWLWLVPLGVAAGALGRRRLPAVRAAVLAGIGVQVLLAAAWMPEPQRLFNGLFPPDVWQPSLFPAALMLSLPRLGPHAGMGYAPNVFWVGAALALLAAGFLRHPRLRWLPMATAVLASPFVLPVDDPLRRGAQGVERRYEAEHLCRSEVTPFGCRQRADRRSTLTGPWIRLPPGAYEVVVTWRDWAATPRDRGSLAVTAGRGRTTLVRRDFRLMDGFGAARFRLDGPAWEVEFAVSGPPGLEFDAIDLRRARADSEPPS